MEVSREVSIPVVEIAKCGTPENFVRIFPDPKDGKWHACSVSRIKHVL